MNQELAVRQQGGAVARTDELTARDVIAQVQKIQEVMAAVMVEGVHYGAIPGTDKPTLLKPGAEKLDLTFRLEPEFETQELWHPDGHLTVTATCTLYKISTGDRWGAGKAICTSREEKYAYRTAKRTCPACHAETIIKGKAEYGGGWVCFKKQGGCGAKFPDGDAAVESQTVGKVANENLADTYNTVMKMACKRAHVAASLNATAASDIFTQDLEDSGTAVGAGEGAADSASAPPTPESKPKKASKAAVQELRGLLVALGKTEREADEALAAHRERAGLLDAAWVAGQTARAREYLETVAVAAEPEPDGNGDAPLGDWRMTDADYQDVPFG